MARRKKQQQAEETLVDLVEVKGQASDFFEKNQTNLLLGLTALLLLVGAYIFYTQFVKAPKEKEAMEALAQAQTQFERDSFALALTNPGGGFSGLLDIIDNYSGTKAANTARYYAGISYLQLGQNDAAIDYLDDFSAGNTILSYTKYGAMGDAYSEKNEFDNAIASYKKAAAAGSNEVLASYYLKKLGLLYEKQGNASEAKAAFEKIREQFPTSTEGADIEKYITRVAAKG